MKFGITFKLFFAIMLCCSVIALAMVGAGRYSFNRGFLGYLNDQEDQRVASLRPTLANAYLEHGSWDFLRDQPSLWFSLLLPPGTLTLEQSRAANRPPAIPPEADLTGLNLRVSLLDQNRQLIIGSPRVGPAASFKSIEARGRTVGWIALVPFQEVSTGAALRFQQQQERTGWVIFASATVLTALVAWLLSRMVLAPVRRIAASTHLLASGDYATRVAPGSNDELGALAQDFNQLALTLGKNESLRRDFMSDVSHELRTPLAALRGELDAIEDGVRPLSADSVQPLQVEVATLGKLVDDLYELSLSDVGALSYRMRRVDVLEVLRLSLDAFEPRFAGRLIAVQVSLQDSPMCIGDPDRLRQLFNNVLENTLHYTAAGGKLVISASDDGKLLRLDFNDSKPGVPEDKLPLVFERFFRVQPPRNRSQEGAGLGLAISRNIVEAHQGHISAQASPLGGLWITVALPVARGEAG